MVRIYITLVIVISMLTAVPVQAQKGQASPQDQRAKLHQLAGKMKSDVYPIRKTMMEKRMTLAGMYAKYDLNEKKARGVVTEISKLQRRMLDANHQNQIRLRKILGRQDFDQFLKAVEYGPDGSTYGSSRSPKRMNHGGSAVEITSEDLDRDALNRLKLDPKQMERVRRQLSPINATRSSALNKLRVNTGLVRELYSKYDLDQKRAQALLNQINASQKQMLESSFDRQVELRKVLTEEQFNTLMQNVKRGMQHRHGSGHRTR